MLGIENHTPENIERIRKVLEKPLQAYARQLGIQSGIGQFVIGQTGIISQAVSWIPGMQHVEAVGRQATQVLNMPKQAIEKANEVYMRPFTELSTWMSQNYSQLMIASYRDPYLNKTLKPTLAAIIDEAFPGRDLNSNYDPLNTSQEHALDMAKQKIGQFKEKIEAFKNDHPIIGFGMDILKNVLQDEGVQRKIATKIAGSAGESALAASKQFQASIADPNSFSAHFAFWMDENFDEIVRLAPQDKRAQVQNHAVLFKAAFSGRILTKEDIDTIKGKWQVTRLIESGLQSAFHTFKNLTVDDSSKDERQRKLINILKSNNHQKLQELLNDEKLGEAVKWDILLKLIDLEPLSEDKLHTTLTYAIQHCSDDFIMVLLNECKVDHYNINNERVLLGIDLNKQTAGVTPLQYALMHGRTNVAIQLLRLGSDPNAVSMIGHANALMIAAKNGQGEVVDMLLENEQVHLEAKGFRERTALHFAIQNGQFHEAVRLIEAGADFSALDANGKSPLGLYINSLIVEDKTPEQVAFKLKTAVESLRPAIEKSINLQLHSGNVSQGFVRQLETAIMLDCELTTQSKVNIFDHLFNHKQFQAIKKAMDHPSNKEVLQQSLSQLDEQVLLAHLQTSFVNAKNRSIAQLIMENSTEQTINRCLLKLIGFSKKYPFNALDRMDQTILETLAGLKHLDQTVTLAILNQFIYKNQKELVNNLLNEQPALINAQDALGNTPLHYAIKFGHYELANTLMKEYHADVTIKNINKHSPHENWGGTSYFSRLVGPLREWWPKSVERTPQDQLEKQFTQNLLKIRKNIDEMTKKFSQPEQNKKIIYETLQRLFRDKQDDEVRNGTIDEILSLAASDNELFKLYKEKGESLVILAAHQQDQGLVGRLIDSLLNKNPDARLNVCMMFLNQILSEKVDTSQDEHSIMVLEYLLKLPENGEDNSLLYQRDAQAQTPLQKAFSNHHFKLMYTLLEKSSDSLSLSIMDHLINNNLTLAHSCAAQQSDYLADLIQFEPPHQMADFLQSVWQKGDESLKKLYFNHATGAAINEFLKTFKQPGYFNISKARLPIKTFVQLFTQDELDHFISQKLSTLDDDRVLELLELQLSSKDDQKDVVKRIIEAKPEILNKQDQNGRTPLHYAIKNSQWPAAVYLMKKEADVTIKNNSHHAPYDNWYGAHAGSYIPGQKAALWSYENTQKTQQNQADEKDIKLAKNREKGSLIMMTAYHQKDVADAIAAEPDKKIEIIFNKIKALMITPKPAEVHAMSDQDYKRTVRDLIQIFIIEYKVNPHELLGYQDNEQVRGLSLFQHESKNTLLNLAIQKKKLDFVEMLVTLNSPTNIPNADDKTALDLLQQFNFEKHPKAMEILDMIKAQQEEQRIQEIDSLDVPSDKPNKQAEKQSEAEAETVDGPTTVNRRP